MLLLACTPPDTPPIDSLAGVDSPRESPVDSPTDSPTDSEPAPWADTPLDEPGFEVTVDNGLPPTRFLMPFRRQDQTTAVQLVDEQGRVVWLGELPEGGNPKGVGLLDRTVYVLQDSHRMDDPAVLHAFDEHGERTSHTPGVVLHHDLAVREDGFYGIGWDLREHGGHQVLGDTLVRFQLDGTVDELWNAWDEWDPPNEELLTSLEGKSGTYDGDVIAWTYFNSVSQNPRTGAVVGTNGAVDQGPVVVGVGHFGQGDVAYSEGHPFELIHSGWLTDDDQLIVYNRRREAATVETWSLGAELTHLSRLEPGIANETVGNAMPLDFEDGLLVVAHPNPAGTIQVWDGTELVFEMVQSEHPHIGYVQGYSIRGLDR